MNNLTEEERVYLLMGGNPFSAMWQVWTSVAVVLLVPLFLCIISCNHPKVINNDDRKYQLTFTMGIIGYIHGCDKYEKKGNLYLLYKDGKLSETIDAGGAMVTIKSH